MADGDGIGGGGTLPDDRSVKSGLDYVTATAARDLTWQPGDVFKGATQRASAQLTGEFHIYREPAGSDGTEVYLVAFIGDGLFSPHASGRQIMSDEVLTGHDRNDRDPALGKGFFHYRADVSVKPNPTGQPISWVCTAPTTENRSETIQDQVVYSYTTSSGAESDGETFKVSMGTSTTDQHWTGVTDTIKDWYVVEESDAGSNTAAWTYAQSRPWDGRANSPSDFGSWWENAFNMGGGWDDVKSPVEMSKQSMQYHYIAAWRFFRPASSSPFVVTINGTATHHLCAIAMPQLQGHHHIDWTDVTLSWSKNLDLKALTTFK